MKQKVPLVATQQPIGFGTVKAFIFKEIIPSKLPKKSETKLTASILKTRFKHTKDLKEEEKKGEKGGHNTSAIFPGNPVFQSNRLTGKR